LERVVYNLLGLWKEERGWRGSGNEFEENCRDKVKKD